MIDSGSRVVVKPDKQEAHPDTALGTLQVPLVRQCIHISLCKT